MSEAAVVNSFFVFRVFLVGGILLILPRITRRGLVFGVYVGEAFSEGDEARRLMRDWDRGCVMVMAVSLVVGLTISFFGHPVRGNLTGTAVLLASGFALYLRSYARVRALIPPEAARQAQRSTAGLAATEPKGEGLAKIVLLVCVLTALATLAYALTSYQAMPDRVPRLTPLDGGARELTDKSILTVLYGPSLNLVFGPLFALFALLTATANHSLREGVAGRSAQAQEAFRATVSHVFSGSALLYCALLTLYSVQVVRVKLSQTPSLGTGIFWLAGVVVVFMGGSLFRIMKRYGQGAALMERGAEEGPLTGGLADNAHWVWGMFYVNRGDPSMMVESRFGIGYTLNYGHRSAVLLTVAAVALILALLVLGFFLKL
jgi:uncharacterized membrane protein